MQQLQNEVFAIFTHFNVLWKSKFLCQNALVHLLRILIVEWRSLKEHFINQNTQCPPVHSMVQLLFLLENLRGLVMRRVFSYFMSKFLITFFSKAKINQCNIAYDIRVRIKYHHRLGVCFLTLSYGIVYHENEERIELGRFNKYRI